MRRTTAAAASEDTRGGGRCPKQSGRDGRAIVAANQMPRELGCVMGEAVARGI